MSPSLSLSRKKKSLLLLSRSMVFPSLILWALLTIWLVSSWRKIWFNSTTLKEPDAIISFSTFPGPTEGSWLASPTNTNLVPGTAALKREFIKKISTMDISSTMITSVSMGFPAFRSNFMLSPLLESPFNSSSL